jgi:Fe-S cluster assembly scaffold protein SufB
MNEKEEEKLEAELIPKLCRRLDRIRAHKRVEFPWSTYDTNAVLTEVGAEIRQARIAEEREKQRRSFKPTDAQMKWINDLRKQVDETAVDSKEFTTSEQIDAEIARLKNKRRIQEKL